MPTGTCGISQRGVSGSWTNIYTGFGASLSDGALSALLTWPEVKQRVQNESRLENGIRIDENAPVVFQSRTITLPIHIMAPDFATLLQREKAFFEFISTPPKGITLELYGVYGLSYADRLSFRLKYLSCTQYGVYKGTLGKFMVRFIEPAPGNAVLLTATSNDNDNETTEEGEE